MAESQKVNFFMNSQTKNHTLTPCVFTNEFSSSIISMHN